MRFGPPDNQFDCAIVAVSSVVVNPALEFHLGSADERFALSTVANMRRLKA